MWHASVSLQTNRGWVTDEARCERLAVRSLAGVGGDHEWWVFGLALVDSPGIGHLRVPVTEAEYVQIPCGVVITDAGETGPQRPRTLRGAH